MTYSLDTLHAWIFPRQRNDVIAVLDAEIDSLLKEHDSFAKLLEDNNGGGDSKTLGFSSRRSDLTREHTVALTRVAGDWPARKEVREVYVDKLVALNRELRDHLVKLGVVLPAPEKESESESESETATLVGDRDDGRGRPETSEWLKLFFLLLGVSLFFILFALASYVFVQHT